MPPPSWSAPAVLLITAPNIDIPALRSSTADAIGLALPTDAAIETVTDVRPDLPVVVLADLAEPEALHVLARGADQVLPSSASMQALALAVRQAIARRAGAVQRRSAGAHRPVAFHDSPQLRAVARLAGGLAHEYNNLLTVIVANLEQLEGDAGDAKAALGGIGTAARQAAVLTRQLLAFGRQQTLMPSAVDVVAHVADAMPAVERAAGARIRVVHQPAASPIHVRVDRGQLQDVLVSLVTIAGDDMADGGTVTVATDVHEVTGEDRRRRPWLPEGRFARIRVADTGPGLDDDALPHLFEPFFAPEPSTRRRGLAMSSVYGVVKQSDGFIWADSRRGAGTTVTILLPVIEPPVSGPATRDPGSDAAPIRVLLVEDTVAVREALSAMLTLRGFAVTAVETAEEALARAQAQSFDVLVTDVVLAGQSGPSLAADFRRRAPGVPVILMSGYSASTLDMRDLAMPRAFLQKPFPMQSLVDRIHELLDWPQSSASTSDASP